MTILESRWQTNSCRSSSYAFTKQFGKVMLFFYRKTIEDTIIACTNNNYKELQGQ